MNRRSIIEADIRNLERQRRDVASAEERMMLELMLGDRLADLAINTSGPATADRPIKSHL